MQIELNGAPHPVADNANVQDLVVALDEAGVSRSTASRRPNRSRLQAAPWKAATSGQCQANAESKPLASGAVEGRDERTVF